MGKGKAILKNLKNIKQSNWAQFAVTAGLLSTMYFSGRAMLLHPDNWHMDKMHASVVTIAEQDYYKIKDPLSATLNEVSEQPAEMTNIKEAFLEYYSKSEQSVSDAEQLAEDTEQFLNYTANTLGVLCLSGITITGAIAYQQHKYEKSVREKNERER